MKRFFLFSLTIFLFNCTEDLQNDRLNSFLNLETELTQRFLIAPDSIINIQGEKGTKISFKTEDLEGILNGPIIKDSLQVNLIELTNKQDLLYANAQTVSNGKWLISGGAFKIDILVNGEKLNLKDGKTIKVQFPKNSTHEKMRLFHGIRDEKNDMIWQSSKIEVKSNPYVIFIKESSILDTILSKKLEVDLIKKVYVLDTLGFIDYKKIEDKLSKTNYFDIKKDTLRIFRKYVRIIDDNFKADIDFMKSKEVFKVKDLESIYNKKEIIIDSVLIDLRTEIFSELREVWGIVDTQISKIELDTLKNVISKKDYENYRYKYYMDIEQNLLLENKTNSFYKAIEVSKLGWINIDKFAPEEEKVNIKFQINKNVDAIKTYIIDEINNTILNIWDNNIDIPINRSFLIISFGIKDNTFYAFKKSSRFTKESIRYSIDLKKINKSQMKSFLELR